MRLNYFDIDSVTPAAQKRQLTTLGTYRTLVNRAVDANDVSVHEYALAHAKQPALHELLASLAKDYKDIKHLVLVGIGGSNLGTLALHSVLDAGKVTLHTLDTISAHDVLAVTEALKREKNVKKVAVCVVSKSGNTTETLTMASVLLDALKTQFGDAIYGQTIFIGDAGTSFMKTGKRMGVRTISMPTAVGGRYSVMTEVGLVPLTLLKHDVDAIIGGFIDAQNEQFELLAAEAASRVCLYHKAGFKHYNIFVFDKRLMPLAAWYRQLLAESVGKQTTTSGQPVKTAMVPTITTPVELHSVGQLIFAKTTPMYTDFITFDGAEPELTIPGTGIASVYKKRSLQEVAVALYGGVIAAYQEATLPYRSAVMAEDVPYSLGLFVGMRMREVMYLASLLDVDAFDQPNVELYKSKTRQILGL